MAEEAVFTPHAESRTPENYFLARLLTDPAASKLPLILPTGIIFVWGELSKASLRFAHGNARQVFIFTVTVLQEGALAVPGLAALIAVLLKRSWGFVSGLQFCAIYICPGIKLADDFPVFAP